MTTFAVLGDVHGNARALRAALTAARSGPFDSLVFLGDLLTYGHDIEEIIELVREAQVRDRAVLLIGNHDQLYFDLAGGRTEYLDTLPSWIRESVEHTCSRLDLQSFQRDLLWTPEYIADEVLFAHASPFGPGDFRYLNSEDEVAQAASKLGARGLSAGIFGHTHRARFCDARATVVLNQPQRPPTPPPHVINAGSVGQPRDDERACVVLRLEVQNQIASGTFERVSYDVASHVRSLRDSGLSTETIERLCGFFRAGGAP